MTTSQKPTFDTFKGLFNESEFVYRHLGSNETKQADLLSAIGYQDMASFINDTVPEPVRLHKDLDLPLAMSEHAAVKEVGAIGVPNDERGEDPKIFVVKKGDVTEQELIDFGKKQLTGYKRPRHVQFVDELPKSNVGKILRKELRKMEGLE